MESLEHIAAEIESCRTCRKWGTGNAVPGEGNPDAKIVFIGEAPGREESKTGRPFVGRSGKFLRDMLRLIDLDENDIYITSPVKYFPKGKKLTMKNIMHGKSHLFSQLSVIAPGIVVLMGSTACIAVLDKKVQITKEHGKIVKRDGTIYLITFHPASAMRFPDMKKAFSRDFEKLRKLIKNKP